MKVTKKQLRKIIREAMGSPDLAAIDFYSSLPLSLQRLDPGIGPQKDAWLSVRDGLSEAGDDAAGTFAMLALDLGVDPQEMADNFPSLAKHIRSLSSADLVDIAESLV